MNPSVNQIFLPFVWESKTKSKKKQLEHLENFEASHILLVHKKNEHLLESLGKKLSTNKIQYKKGHFYSFSFTKNKEGDKASVKRKLQNFLTQLFTPVKAANCSALFFVVEKSTLIDYIKKVGCIDTSIAWKANLNGYALRQVKLPYKKNYHFKKANASVLKDFFSSRFYWFIHRPIQQIKSDGWNLSKGNAPIYRIVFAAICIKLLVAMPLLSFDYNMTWDEPEDRNYFTKVLSYFETFGKDDRCITTQPGNKDYNLHEHLIYYGPLVNLTTAFVNKYISPFPVYETRHLIISLFALIGFIYTAMVLRMLLHWRAAVLGIMFIALTPTIFGHSMNNQKDIPFLSFYIMSFFYILQFVRQLPKVKPETIFMMGISGGLLMSVRIAGLLSFAYLGLFTATFFLWAVRNKKIRFGIHSIIEYLKPLLISFCIAYAITISLWPAAHAKPFKHPFEALSNFEKFGLVHIYEIFEGTRYYMKDFPWYYLPKSISISIPVFVLLGLAIFLVNTPKWIKSKQSSLLLMTGFVFIFPLLYIIYKDSTVYSSWRHVLFVYPPILILSVIGWEKLFQIRIKAIRWFGIGILLTLALKTEYWMYKNHPYQYMYYNELVGGVKGAYGKYELDYWTQSPKEAVKWILDQENDTSKISIASNNDWHTLDYVANHEQIGSDELILLQKEATKLGEEIKLIRHEGLKNNWTDAELSEAIKTLKNEKQIIGQKIKKIKQVTIRWAREQEWTEKYWDYAIWTTRTLSQTQMKNGAFPPKGTIKTITVDGKPIAAIVKRPNQYAHLASKFQKKGNIDSAIWYYNQYLQFDSLEEEAHRGLGLCFLQKGQFQKSKHHLYRSIIIRPENYYAWNLLGVLYNNENNLDSAINAYENAVRFKTNFSTAYAGLGEIYLQKNQLKNALAQFEKAVEFGGMNIRYANNLGRTYFQMGNDQKAGSYASFVLQNDLSNRRANYIMAQILLRNGRKKEAQKYMQRAQGR